MTFQPLIGTGGYSGWRLLTRTADAQKAIIAKDPAMVRDAAEVRDSIGRLDSADELIGNFRLLRTSLSAFGLEADVGKKAFLRKVLTSDPSDPKSFANRLSDKRYRAFAEAFGFASDKKRPAGLADQVIARHLDAELERRVGTVDGNLRLALNARRELAVLASAGSSDNAKWYSVLGSLPLRKVFEGALGLGSSFGKIPVDRQLAELKNGVEKLVGSASASAFADRANVEKLVQRFLIRASATTPAQSSYNAALTLLTD